MVNDVNRPEDGLEETSSGEPVLAALGVSATDEQIYRELLARPGATISELASHSGRPEGQLSRILSQLEAKGLVSLMPGRPLRFLPTSPDLAIEGLIHRRRRELETARVAARTLVDNFRMLQTSNAPVELVEVIGASEALHERFVQLQATATEEIVLLDKPPYADPLGVNEFELDALRRGVTYRVIYDTAAFEMPGQLDWLAVHTEAGEEARVITDVPIKLAVADRRLGLVPLSTVEPALEGAILVHHSSLLEALNALFDTLWTRSAPLRPGVVPSSEPPHGRIDIDRDLLTLMAAGLKDEAIARQLGIGVRTVGRRMTRMMEQLGARTRFQLGLQAARLGWL